MKKNCLKLLLATAAPLALLALPPAVAQVAAPDRIVLAQLDDLRERVREAEAAVAEAEARLREALENDGDVDTAREQLAAAQAELDAASAALAQAQAAPPPVAEPAPEQQAQEPAAPEEPAAEQQAQEPAAPEEPAAEQQAQEPAAPEEPAAEQQAQEPAAPEEPAAEQQAQEPPAPEEPAAEQQAQEPPAPEEPAAEQQAQEPAAEGRDRRERRERAERPSPRAEEQAAAPVPAQPPESIVENQLEALGDQQAVDRIRALRERLNQELGVPDPAAGPGDQAGERERRGNREGDQAGRPGRDRDRADRAQPPPEQEAAPQVAVPDGGEVVRRYRDRAVINLEGNLIIRPDIRLENDRFLFGARDVEVERLPGGRTRTIIEREDGSQIVTVRDRDGAIVTRSRIDRRGREFVLIDNTRFEDRPRRRPPPPPRLDRPPAREEFVETRRATPRDIRAAIERAPVRQVVEDYSLNDILYNVAIREYLPRIDLNTITFDFGSAALTRDQFRALDDVGLAIEDYLADNPDEVFLIEGHTDAVGSEYDNLLLSDRRAEAVAVALSSNYDIPPENLITQGYGESFLKINTQAAERENRRVAIRRITPLLRGVASR